MKKLLALVLATLMLLSLFIACGKKEEAPDTINIYTLNGTTGFGMAKLMNDNAENGKYTVTVKADASDVTAALINGDIDIAALPTNAAANVFNKTDGGVKILAVNTLGCLYLSSPSSAKRTICFPEPILRSIPPAMHSPPPCVTRLQVMSREWTSPCSPSRWLPSPSVPQSRTALP